MTMELRFWAATDTGRVRDHNEDNFLVDKNLQLFVVCDGMGGHAAGEVASAVCVRTVREVVASKSDLVKGLRDEPEDEELADQFRMVLRQAIKAGNAKIHQMAREDPSRKGMGTTCTALAIAGDRGFVGHVGDSRLYRLRNERVEQVTDDHSLLNEMIRQGKVAPGTTEEEFEHQNAVTRAVGVRESVKVDSFAVDIAAGDRLLMCSDGLCEYVGGVEELRQVMGDGEPKETTQACIDHANDGGGKDNITVIVVDCEDEMSTRSDADTEQKRPGVVSEEDVNILRQIPYFHYLDPKEINEVLQMASVVEVEAGEQVVGGDDNERLYLILEGAVTLELDGEGVSRLEPGEHFGEMALIDAQGEDDTKMVVRSLEESTFLAIERDEFVKVLRTAPSLAIKLLWNFVQVFAERLQEVPPEFRYRLDEPKTEPEAISDVTSSPAPKPEVGGRLAGGDEGEGVAVEEEGDRGRSSTAPGAGDDDGGVSLSMRSSNQRDTAPLGKGLQGESDGETPSPRVETLPPEGEADVDGDEPTVQLNVPAAGEVADVDDEVSSKLEEPPDFDGETGGLAEETGGLDEEIGGFDEEIGGFDEEIGGFDEETGGLDEEIGGLDEEIGGLDEEIGGLDEEIGGLDEEIGGLDEEIGGLDEEIGGLDGEVTGEDKSGDEVVRTPLPLEAEDSDEAGDDGVEVSTVPEEAPDAEYDDDLRSTVQIDWGDEELPDIDSGVPASLREESQEEDVGDETKGHEGMETEEEGKSADEKSSGNISESLKNKLRSRLESRPAPSSGVLEKAKMAEEEVSESAESPGEGGASPTDAPAVDETADNGTDSPDDSDVEEESDAASSGNDQPKIMVSPELLTDPDDD